MGADMSVIAFANILGAIHRSSVLATYRTHPGLQQRLSKECKECRVNMTFGLHWGWAIEGAVGSEFKIDASYVSPNVSIAESIERATQIYKVSIIISESVVELCSLMMKDTCRLIDCVLITGSTCPMILHSLDLDYKCLAVEEVSNNRVWNQKER